MLTTMRTQVLRVTAMGTTIQPVERVHMPQQGRHRVPTAPQGVLT
jgi:hypothetical protein